MFCKSETKSKACPIQVLKPHPKNAFNPKVMYMCSEIEILSQLKVCTVVL